MLPNVVAIAIGAVVTYLVVNGLQLLAAKTGRDLTPRATAFATAITAIVVFSINTILALVAQLDPHTQRQITGILQVLVVILSAFGLGLVQQTVTAALSNAVERAVAKSLKVG